MPKKIFTTLGGTCPHIDGVSIDSEKCRKCQYYFRMGTGTFFWCKHPDEQVNAQISLNVPVSQQGKRKRGRPKGSTLAKAPKTPAKREKSQKR